MHEMDAVEAAEPQATAIERLNAIDDAIGKAVARLDAMEATAADLSTRLEIAGADALLEGRGPASLPGTLEADLATHEAERRALETAISGLNRRRPQAEMEAADEVLEWANEQLTALASEIGEALAEAEQHRRAMAEAAGRARVSLAKHRQTVADVFAPAWARRHPESGPVISDNLPNEAARPPVSRDEDDLFHVEAGPGPLPRMLHLDRA